MPQAIVGTELLTDPRRFFKMCWPDFVLAEHQLEIIDSVDMNKETFVCAGNGLGKDFIAAFIALWWFVSRSPSRVVTTSVKFDQLSDVLWGEMRRLINCSAFPLPIQYNHMKIRQVKADGSFADLSELVGQAVAKGEGLLGRHLPQDIPRTLLILDEASGIDTEIFVSARTWAHHILAIGNPFECQNFFREAVKGGNLESLTGKGKRRNVLKVRAEDSPNVQVAFEEIRNGNRRPEKLLIRSDEQPWGIYSKEEFNELWAQWEAKGCREAPTKTLIPGMIGFADYLDRRLTWDKVMQTISLDGEFYEGAEVLLYPPTWLNRANDLHEKLRGQVRKAMAIGVDPAEGGDSSVWTAVDMLGVIESFSMKTPDTSVIPTFTLSFMAKHGCSAQNVVFDRGGGGQQHADALRKLGYKVRTVAFGESADNPNLMRRLKSIGERVEEKETRYVYKNRRAEMYGMLRELVDPAYNPQGFAIPKECRDLRHQLSPIPLLYDKEGRLFLPPKHKDPGTESNVVTLTDLIGRSPDDADSLVLAVFGMLSKATRAVAGGVR